MSRQLLRTTSLVSVNTFISRILGFIRDVVLAHYFGATAGADAFFVAFRIPNFMRAMFAEGAFSQAFVPVLSKYRGHNTPEETRTFINHVTGALGSALTIIVILGVLCSPWIISLFAPGFAHGHERYLLASHMLRIIFPYILLISMAAMCGAILNTYDSFGIPSITPSLLNVVLIFTAVFIASRFSTPIYAIAWAVLAAGVFQLVFQLPFLERKKLLPRPTVSFKDPGVRRVLKLMVPALIGVSIVQISLVLDNVFASFLKVGSISWLYYSSRLMNFPLGVFGVAIATVILPKLSRQHINKDSKSYSQTVDWALRLLLLIGLPSAVGLFILSGPLLSTLFQTGQFNQFDVLMARESLMAFSIGVAAFMLVKVLASAFYSMQDMMTPMKIAAVAVLVKIILNIILIFPLKHAGLALSTSIAAFVNVGLLLVVLFRRKIYTPQAGWVFYFLRLFIAIILMASVLYVVGGHLSAWFNHDRFWRILHLSLTITVGVIVYFGSLLLTGLRLDHFRAK